MKKPFAQLLQNHIDNSGMKRTHIASVAGISYNYLLRLLGGTRHPSDQVILSLSQALHLPNEQTSELLITAGFPPPPAMFNSTETQGASQPEMVSSTKIAGQISRITQQLYRLAQEIPDTQVNIFLEEMRYILGYARYKYVLLHGIVSSHANADENHHQITTLEASHLLDNNQAQLNIIAQIIGELHTDYNKIEETQDLAEDTLLIIDHLISNLLSGEASAATYPSHLVIQMLDILRNGTVWEIRRRIAEALPYLCRLDITGTMHLMEALRMDIDERHGRDIRRRVVEALPVLFDTEPQLLPTIIRLLYPHSDDDIYVALATMEVCEDIQVKIRPLREQSKNKSQPEIENNIQDLLPEITRIQRQVLISWSDSEQESLQFSMALHNLLAAPDTLFMSLREGLQTHEKLVQLVTVRYLERILLTRPLETLQMYQKFLQSTPHKNVRRAVAKAVPGILQCLKETSLPIRSLARSVILALAEDSDIFIRRAVADHAMQIFSIDREFLLELLRQMQKDKDQAIRYRLRPVALRLAQVWLTWYAETVKLVNVTNRNHTQVIKQLFGE